MDFRRTPNNASIKQDYNLSHISVVVASRRMICLHSFIIIVYFDLIKVQVNPVGRAYPEFLPKIVLFKYHRAPLGNKSEHQDTNFAAKHVQLRVKNARIIEVHKYVNPPQQRTIT